MADDSDIDSWYSKKYDEEKKTGPCTISATSEFGNSKLPCTSHNYGMLGLSNGYFVNSLHRSHEAKQKPSRFGPEVRFINPAIYAESLTTLNEPQDSTANSCTEEEIASLVIEVRCGDSNDLADGFSALSVNGESPRTGGGDHFDQTAVADTYRCSQSDTSRTSTLTSTNNSKSTTRLVRRCAISESSKVSGAAEEEDVQRLQAAPCALSSTANKLSSQCTLWAFCRFSLNGRRVVQFSSTSLSASSTSFSERRTNGLALARKIAHEEWVQKKQRAASEKSETERRAELRRREEEDRVEMERLERERLERENFLRWQERKKKDEANRKLAVERELDLQRRLKAVEDRAAIAKIIHLQQWARKKEEAQKAQQKEQELKRKAIAEERKKRLEESSQAFEKWRESAKRRPRPATQGLLPHQRAKPSFVNPKPWQRIVDDEQADESQKDLTIKKVISQPKNNARKSIASHQ